jgi:hypothetical protein
MVPRATGNPPGHAHLHTDPVHPGRATPPAGSGSRPALRPRPRRRVPPATPFTTSRRSWSGPRPIPRVKGGGLGRATPAALTRQTHLPMVPKQPKRRLDFLPRNVHARRRDGSRDALRCGIVRRGCGRFADERRRGRAVVRGGAGKSATPEAISRRLSDMPENSADFCTTRAPDASAWPIVREYGRGSDTGPEIASRLCNLRLPAGRSAPRLPTLNAFVARSCRNGWLPARQNPA